jgi:hypothetical protein
MKKVISGVMLAVLVLFVLIIALVIEEAVTARLEVRRVEYINERMAALRDRVKTNPPDTNALNLLIRAVHSDDPWTRGAAIGFLGQAGSNAGPAVTELTKVLVSKNLFDASLAAGSLGGIGRGARQAIPALITAVRRHPEDGIGFFSAESLGQIADSNDVQVVAVLTQAAKSSDERMRNSANQGLAALGLKPNVQTN